MKRHIFCTLICTGLLAAAATGFAGEITVHGTQPATRVSPDEAATNACLTAFIRELIPGSNARVHTIVQPGDQIFMVSSPIVDRIDVSMSAKAVNDSRLLARARCTVSRAAKVEVLHVKVMEPLQLAGLGQRDFRFTVAAR
jgi:hypothetical protein